MPVICLKFLKELVTKVLGHILISWPYLQDEGNYCSIDIHILLISTSTKWSPEQHFVPDEIESLENNEVSEKMLGKRDIYVSPNNWSQNFHTISK